MISIYLDYIRWHTQGSSRVAPVTPKFRGDTQNDDFRIHEKILFLSFFCKYTIVKLIIRLSLVRKISLI